MTESTNNDIQAEQAFTSPGSEGETPATNESTAACVEGGACGDQACTHTLPDGYAENGLTKEDVDERIAKGLVNGDMNIRTKTYGQIIVSNVFTLFNIINIILAVLIFAVKPFVDALLQCGFLLLILTNMLSGLIQEIRAKQTIDKLSLLSQPKARVMRGGEVSEIALKDIVMDDMTELSAGAQVCADAVVLSGVAEVNESLITGEPDAILKQAGDKILSGSFVVSGSIRARVEHIGADNYAQKISSGAKYIKKPNSDIVCSLRAIVRIMSFIVGPLGIGLFLKSYLWDGISVADSILAMTAAMISMIPQGLVALTCVVFAISIIKLSKHNTLSQDLYCIETLARVDMLCLDKTGTITEGCMQVVGIEVADGGSEEEIKRAMSAIVKALPDNNPTYNAIKDYFGSESELSATHTVPFSSARKYSGASFGADGSYLMGAAEFLLPKELCEAVREKSERHARNGERVIVVVKTDKELENYDDLGNVVLLGFVLITDKIRDEAPETLRFFAEQGVTLKIISGDNPVTVSAIALRAGLVGGEKYVDATTLLSADDIFEAAKTYTVFGRVTPEQKLALIKALKAQGHTVAMTGDGVNDVLALKEADCSVAMAAGSDAARTVSQLVLMDSNFASMPKIVAEGRKNINNLQRTAGLYLTKTVYSVLLAVLFCLPWVGEYPYEPIHLTFMGAFTIGIPSTLLALAPNTERVSGRFIDTTMARSLPGALTLFVCICCLQLANVFVKAPFIEVETVSFALISLVSFAVLFRVCLPPSVWRISLFTLLLAAFLVCWWVLTDNPIAFVAPLISTINMELLPLEGFTRNMLVMFLPIVAVAAVCMTGFSILIEKYAKTRGFKIFAKVLRLNTNK